MATQTWHLGDACLTAMPATALGLGTGVHSRTQPSVSADATYGRGGDDGVVGGSMLIFHTIQFYMEIIIMFSQIRVIKPPPWIRWGKRQRV